MALPEHVDVVVIGAGISGINATYHLTREFPGKTICVLEAHEDLGGTWLIHNYPGVRSDTELYTLGFDFKPWTGRPYAGGDEIMAYLRETVEEFDLEQHFTYNSTVTSASWSSERQAWTLEGKNSTTSETFQMTASFLWMCHGYYEHSKGYTPSFNGMDVFQGEIIHPQTWTNPDLDGKQVAVIGSGATMATLVPAIANTTGHVTVIQRSPSYFFQSPNRDDLADQLRSLDTPAEWIHEIIRKKAVSEMETMTKVQMDYPDLSKAGLIKMVADQLPEGYDVETHFTPRHLPHEQRVARILNGDLFTAISEGKVTMITDTIDHFTATGIVTGRGTTVPADVVITATGFDLSVFGGVTFTVDGEAIDPSKVVTYRGILFTELPNLAWTFGSLRLSWTMRANLAAEFIVRLLHHMDEQGATSVLPTLGADEAEMTVGPFIDPSNFNPGYAERSRHRSPRSGSLPQWQLNLDYWNEATVLPTAPLDDGCLVFTQKG
jgi:cation diffusion facilitator CzcD-associated flavoprotein CzcO